MTALHQPLEPPALRDGAYRRLAPTVFAVTLFLSALLLFAVQPMFTKMVLPRLGGAPTVWSVAMVFFQAALLVGYAYAHLIIRFLPLGYGALVHLVILAVAATTLPIGIALGFEVPPTTDIALWLIGLFAVSIGLPFAVLSASAPLLQGWFAASGHPQASNPYVLYSASNLGSLAALIAYPTVIEPFLSLNQQTHLWSLGFAALMVLVATAGLFVVGRPSLARSVSPSEQTTMSARLAWVVLAAIPAGLVIAVTSYITTDVAAAPFLWVLPLALYLLTFIGVFRDRPWMSHQLVATAIPFVVAPVAIFLLSRNTINWALAIAFNLLAFFLLAWLCHSEVYRRRPEPARLTAFYLCVSFGGVIGGVFAALVAPLIFSNVYEYPLLIVAALLVLPGVWSGTKRLLIEAGPALLLAAIAIAVKYAFDLRVTEAALLPLQIALIVLASLMLLQRRRAARFASLVVLAFVVTALWQPGYKGIETARSFFGVHQVVETADASHRILLHGTTVHGAQRLQDERAPPEPLTYYYFGGPISQTISATRAMKKGKLARVAVVGLGSGSLACHKRRGESWTFYEIDPEVVRIAKDPRLFSFLSSCAPDSGIVLGDARLTLANAQQRHNLIVIDAFSSDAIPVHLLTREAIASYLTRLEEDGVLVMHISNRHMELGRVVAAVGAAEGLVTYLRQDDGLRGDSAGNYKLLAIVAALARSPKHLRELTRRPGWTELKPDPRVPAWTDDYSNLAGAIVRKKFAP